MLQVTDRPIKYRVMPMGSKGHEKTLKAVYEYHTAKKQGKQCLIMAKSLQEKMRLVTNHNIEPDDIQIVAGVQIA